MIQDSSGEYIRELAVSNVEEFWEILSPQHYVFNPHEKLIFRGQADSTWELRPSLLRAGDHSVSSSGSVRSAPETSDGKIFSEINSLRTFARYCDSTGLRIPSDSLEFRNFLDPTKMMDSFIFHKPRLSSASRGSAAGVIPNHERYLWPSPEYYELMALAQHHGLPTRLLDWSHRSYVAAYFAASGALARPLLGRIAIWILNTYPDIPLLDKLEIIPVPGSNNANLAAQAGMFTLLRQEYTRSKPFTGPECISDYVISKRSKSLAKVTLPTSEARKVLDLSERYGITAATLFPGFDGAARATRDYLACWAGAEWSNGQDIKARTTPVPLREEKKNS